MNIVIVPSWHPDKKNKLAGIFFKEQTVALCKLYPHIDFHVIEINSNEFLISPRFVVNSIVCFFKFLFSNKKILVEKEKENLFIYKKNHIMWSFLIAKKFREKYYYSIFKKIIDKIEREHGKINLTHAHVSFPAGFYCYNLKKEKNIPYVITEHMGPFPFPIFDKKIYLFEKYIKEPIRNSNCVISVSTYINEQISNKLKISSIIIPNMCDEEIFYPARKTANLNSFKFVTTCGKLSKEKGTNNLLNSIKIFVTRDQNTHFYIIGEDDSSFSYMDYAKELQISSFITFYGQKNRLEIADILRDSDAFIQPSEIESFSIACIEALATGIPIVATKCGGPEDIVNEQNGILVDNKSVESLTEGLFYIKQNYHLYNEENIRNDFMSKYSKKAVCSKIMSCYQNLYTSTQKSN